MPQQGVCTHVATPQAGCVHLEQRSHVLLQVEAAAATRAVEGAPPGEERAEQDATCPDVSGLQRIGGSGGACVCSWRCTRPYPLGMALWGE